MGLVTYILLGDVVSEALKFTTKLMLMLSVLSWVVLCAGPLGYKSAALPLQAAMLSLIVSLGIAFVTFILSVTLLLWSKGKGLNQNQKFLVVAILITLMPNLLVGTQLKKATSLPEIHDITTDTLNPPVFHDIVALRKGAPNSLKYQLDGAAETLAALQRSAYPDLKTVATSLSSQHVLELSVQILQDQGLDVVNVDPANNIIEATATSFWYGFKDDLVVRIQAVEPGSRVDLRSVSRVGRSDVGANAARIRAFIQRFKSLEAINQRVIATE